MCTYEHNMQKYEFILKYVKLCTKNTIVFTPNVVNNKLCYCVFMLYCSYYSFSFSYAFNNLFSAWGEQFSLISKIISNKLSLSLPPFPSLNPNSISLRLVSMMSVYTMFYDGK